MGIAKMPGAGSIKITNGKIMEYKSQSVEIPANTFVQSESWTTQVMGAEKSNGFKANESECVHLADNKILIVSQSNELLSARIATISGTEVSFGTEFKRTEKVMFLVSVSKISDNKYLVAYMGSIYSDYEAYVAVLSISGSTITWGTAVRIEGWSSLSYFTAAMLTSTRGVLIGYPYSSSTYVPKAYFFTVSGTTITKGTNTTVGSSGDKYQASINIGTNKILAFRYSRTGSSSLPIYADILTVSGDTITRAGTSAGNITTYDYASIEARIAQLSSSLYVVAYKYNDKYWAFSPISVSGNSVSLGAYKTVNTYYGELDLANQPPALCPISSSKVVAIIADSQTKYIVYSVNASSLTETEALTQLGRDSESASAAITSGTTIFALYDTTNSYGSSYSKVFSAKEFFTGVKPSTGTITGLTQTKVTPTKSGKVWVYKS